MLVSEVIAIRVNEWIKALPHFHGSVDAAACRFILSRDSLVI
jgi:hypothetical protein